MKQQKILLIVLLVFALLLVGAYVLYDNLKDRVDTGMCIYWRCKRRVCEYDS